MLLVTLSPYVPKHINSCGIDCRFTLVHMRTEHYRSMRREVSFGACKAGCLSPSQKTTSCNFSSQALYTLPRQVDTNQRIGFDIDPSGRYLATGSTERQALVYDIESQALVGSLEDQPDAVGGVSFHPHAALVGVCTGQRHFDLDTNAGSDSDACPEDARHHSSDMGAPGNSPSAKRENTVAIHGIGRLGPN